MLLNPSAGNTSEAKPLRITREDILGMNFERRWSSCYVPLHRLSILSPFFTLQWVKGQIFTLGNIYCISLRTFFFFLK